MSNEIKELSQKYSNFKNIGFGSYGTIYRAKIINGKKYVAIKEISKQKLSKSNKKIEKEVQIMDKLKNVNSVQLIELIE